MVSPQISTWVLGRASVVRYAPIKVSLSKGYLSNVQWICLKRKVNETITVLHVKLTDICTLKKCQNQVNNDEEIDLYYSDDGTDDTDDEDYVQMFVFDAMLIDGKGEQKEKAENEMEKTRKEEMSLCVTCTYCMLI